MDIVSTVRKLCEGKNGFRDLFNQIKTYEKLRTLADDTKDAGLFAALIYGKARGPLLQLINDVYNYQDHAVAVNTALLADGLSAADAKRALEIFYKAFGFPGHREMDQSKISTVSDTIGSDFKVEYEGEVQNGKEYGVGIRTCYSRGKWCNYDECVWIDGVMFGYDFAKEIEFGMFETKKIGFVVEDNFVGNIKCFYGEDEEVDPVSKFTV